jgi:membrane protein required for colicin V production
MSVLDIILCVLLCIGVFKGIRNGFLVEFASLLSLFLGIYIAVGFSDYAKNIVSKSVHWNPKTIQIFSFIATFIIVVVGISLFAKAMTKIINVAQLGIFNKLGGGFLRLLKTILIVSVFLNLFEKVNFDNMLAKKETLDKSLFFRPIQQTAGLFYPSIQKWFEDYKKK